ncbi:type IV pilus twitching motility protein PilT [bacterium]|nr:MAG: type IV pilus twitching motility protein PilT [bacterium]
MAGRGGYSQPDVFRGDKEDEKEDEYAGAPASLDDLHIDELLHIIVDKGASDLHICQNSQPMIRLDGKLKPLHFEKFTPGHAQRMLYDILSDDNINKFETTWELDFSYSLPRRARFRVNLYREKGATAAAFRLIPQKIPTVEQLNLPPILKTLCEKPRGLILVTGPTGSGKSTSLAAMINYINENHAHHIITIEDPIEYLHEHKKCIINQREVGADTKSFLNALRGSLREDPDILLVGEMRDIETISLAVTAAETGHLVFATLHTNTAAESIDRMVDVFPPEQQEQIRVQISNNIIAVVAQQLLPRAGAKGRVPANEIMIASSAIRNLIREAKTHQITSMIQMSANVGMFTMDQCLRDLYLKGLVTLDDAYSRCVNKDELTKMINTPQGSSGAQPGMGPGVRPMPTQGR